MLLQHSEHEQMELARDLGMSRATLYRRLNQLEGDSSRSTDELTRRSLAAAFVTDFRDLDFETGSETAPTSSRSRVSNPW